MGNHNQSNFRLSESRAAITESSKKYQSTSCLIKNYNTRFFVKHGQYQYVVVDHPQTYSSLANKCIVSIRKRINETRYLGLISSLNNFLKSISFEGRPNAMFSAINYLSKDILWNMRTDARHERIWMGSWNRRCPYCQQLWSLDGSNKPIR